MAARSRPRALMALLFVTVIWGWTFTWMKQSLNAGEAVLGPSGRGCMVAWYLVLRFGIAAAALAVLLPASRRSVSAPVWRSGALLGGALLVGFFVQMLGLTEVTPAVSAFLTSLYVVFTAILTSVRGTHRVTPALVAGVALATFGAGFIEGPPHIAFGLPEWLTVACAFVFAIHILLTDEITRRLPPLPITLTSFVCVAAGAGAAFSAALVLPGAPRARDVLALTVVPGFVGPLLLSSLIATVVALTLMNLYQREVDPVRAAVLFALEPVWASVVAISSGLGAVGPWLWIGGGSLLAGNLVAELGARSAANAVASTSGEPRL